MRWLADPEFDPARNGLNVLNLRAYTAPIPGVESLSFEFEFASERNGDALDSNAWSGQGKYELSSVPWTPAFTYRYAFFEGDNPATRRNEAFDPLFLGFYDWGYWWQGEIAGEYFLANSNLISHLVRADVAPTDSIGAGLLLYKFRLDHPRAYGLQVTDKNVAVETDLYVDWDINDTFSVSFLGAVANPREAVRQAKGRTKNFSYGMIYVTYNF
jgi:hypothetical protein